MVSLFEKLFLINPLSNKKKVLQNRFEERQKRVKEAYMKISKKRKIFNHKNSKITQCKNKK